MKVEYIFIRKNENKLNKQNANKIRVIPFYEELFINIALPYSITDNSFIFKFEDEEFKIDSTYFRFNPHKRVALSISIKNKNKSAKILNSLDKYLTTSNIHKAFYIVKIYDESSEYYCKKIYPKLSEFERKIRSLIYLILIKSFGSNWSNRTISTELKKEINKKVQSSDSIIEQGLQEMDIGDLEDFLFTSRYWKDIDCILSNELNYNNIKDFEKEKILEIIKTLEKKSLWDMYFSNIKINNIKDNLSKIRDLRNKVAHCKNFTNENYQKSYNLLKNIIKEIDSAISEISTSKYDITGIKDFLCSLGEFTKNIVEYTTQVANSLNFSGLVNLIGKISMENFPEYKNSLPKTGLEQISLHSNPIQNISNNLKFQQSNLISMTKYESPLSKIDFDKLSLSSNPIPNIITNLKNE